MNADEIKRSILLSEVIGRDIKLIANGTEYTACCPFHSEKTASFTINDEKGFYHCFGCGKHGSVIDYIIETRGVDFKEACNILGGGNDNGIKIQQKDILKKDVYTGILPVFPVPPNVAPIIAGQKVSIFNPKKPERGARPWQPEMVHAYKDLAGNLLGYVIRIYINEKKQTPTVLWARRPDGSEGWTLLKFPEPRPLYVTGELIKEKQVIIVEGETSADAIPLLTHKTGIGWPGGVNGVSKAHWQTLAGHSILIWPDKDKPGIKAANEIAEILHKTGVQQIKILIPPTDKPEGWDAADAVKEGWDYNKFLGWAKECAVTYTPGQIAIEKKPADKVKKNTKNKHIVADEDPFRILGSDGELYYYMSRKRQIIFALSASAHTPNNLFRMTNRSYWEHHFPGERGIKYDEAVSALIEAGDSKPVFNPNRVRRGRGAWLDEGRRIFHLGDKILMEHQEYAPIDIKSRYIYESCEPIRLPSLSEISREDALKFIQICGAFNWENPLSGKLLAGWCVIACICGMLEWRPHIWITGGSNTGKSTVTTIVRGMLKPFSRSFGGGGTEPGIRRSIQKDAIPISIDEAESETQRQREKIRQILFLARQSSNGEIIPMVGKDGKVEEFFARSCFCFTSINPCLDAEPDQTRVTRLTLTPDYSGTKEYIQEKYEKLKDIIRDTITPEFASGMMMRAFNNIENLLANIKTFEKAGSAIFKRPRIGEQLSPMIAGEYMCHNTGLISLEDAKKWIEGYNWENHLPDESTKDIWRLFRIILSYRFRINDGSKTSEKTLGQLLLAIANYHTNADYYREEIRQLGIDVVRNEDAFYISNVSPTLEKVLGNTPWEKEWGKRLRELPGATAGHGDKPYYFCAAITARATSVPLSLIRDNSTIIKVPEVLGEEISFEEVF